MSSTSYNTEDTQLTNTSTCLADRPNIFIKKEKCKYVSITHVMICSAIMYIQKRCEGLHIQWYTHSDAHTLEIHKCSLLR